MCIRDRAMKIWPSIIEFLQQSDDEKCDFAESAGKLSALVGDAI